MLHPFVELMELLLYVSRKTLFDKKDIYCGFIAKNGTIQYLL